MRMRNRELLLLAAAALCVGATACGRPESSSATPTGAKSDTATGDTDPPCTAVLTFGQKDAYLDTAGRKNPLLPVHTSTKLEITCPDDTTPSFAWEDDNHGTSFAAKDAQATPILDIVTSLSIELSKSQAGLATMKYAGCECDDTFFSLDTLTTEGLAAIAGNLQQYLDENVYCDDNRARLDADLTAPLSAEKVLDLVGAMNDGACRFISGDWQDAFTHALAEFGSQHHVCNNDASLQKAWFTALGQWAADGTGGDMPDCRQYDALCAPPVLYYSP